MPAGKLNVKTPEVDVLGAVVVVGVVGVVTDGALLDPPHPAATADNPIRAHTAALDIRRSSK